MKNPYRESRARLAGLWLGGSVLGLACMAPALGAVVDYPAGSNNANPILLTDNSTQLQTLTGSATQSGVISESGSSFGIEKIGAGTLIFTGANSYSGGTTITAGTLQIGNGGSIGSGAITDNGALIFNGSGSLTVAAGISGSGAVTQAGSGVTILTGNNSYSGGTTISAGTLEVGFGGSSGSLGNGGTVTDNGDLTYFLSAPTSIGYVIGGTGTVTQVGSNTLTLTVAQGYSGATNILGGTVALTGAGDLSASSDVIVSSGTLDISGITASGTSLQRLENAGTVVMGAKNLTITGTSTNFSGTLSGSGTFTVNGTQTLGGNDTGFTGNFVIGNGATLTVGGGGVLGNGSIADSGTLAYGGNGALVFANVISGTGSVGVTGNGTMVLTAANNYAATIIGFNGVLQVGNGGTTGSLGSGAVTVNGSLIFDRSDTVTIANAISGAGVVDVHIGKVILTGANGYVTTDIDGGATLQVGNGGTTGTLGSGIIFDAGTLSIAHSDAVTIANQIVGTGTGTVSVVSGTAILTSNNNTLPTVTIASGATLQIGAGGTSGTLGANTATDNGAITFNRSDSLTVGTVIGGSGTVNVAGGTAILDSINSYSGGTTIANGATLQLSVSGTLGSGAVTDNGTLAINRFITLANAISGTGNVSINTSNTAFTGNNSYSGTTTIASGTILQIGLNGTSGTLGSGAVINNGILAFLRTDTVTISNVISGTGSVSQQGGNGVNPGTLILDGVNTYTGITQVNVGTLEVGDAAHPGAKIAGPVSVSAGATLSGTGTVGATSVTGGTLSAGGAGAVDTLHVAGNLSLDSASTTLADLTPSTADQVAISGVANIGGTLNAVFGTGNYVSANYTLISSTGLLSGTFANVNFTGAAVNLFSAVTYDAHDVFLTLSNGFSPTTTAAINSGTVTVNGNQTTGGLSSTGSGGTITLASGSTLTDNQSSNTSFSGTLSGAGGFIKIGTGTLILDGANSYTGGTQVNGGALEIGDAAHANASINGPVTVGSGATLLGHGSVNGAVTVGSGGNLQPGGTIGTLTVASATFASGSTYTVETNAAGQANLTVATGAIAINSGAGLVVTPDAPAASYGRATSYTILQAAGGLSGTFASTTSTISTLLPSVSYSGNSATLTLIRPDLLATAASTTNQRGVSAAIVAAGFSPLLATLAPQSDAVVGAAFNQLSGDIHASLRTALVEDSRIIRDTVLDHLGKSVDGIVVWGAGFGGYGSISSDGNAHAVHHNSAGFIVGADLPLEGGFRLGLAGAYTSNDMSLADHSSSADGNSGHIVAYGGWSGDTFDFRVGGDYGWGSAQMMRSVASFSQTDNDHQNQQVGQVFADAGYKITTDSAMVEPYVGIANVSATTGAFAETGGSTELSGTAKTDAQTYGMLGLRASLAGLTLGDSMGLLRPHIDLGWQHAFNTFRPGQVLTFQSMAQSFPVLGVPLRTDAATLRTGFDVVISPKATLSIDYDGSFASRVQNNAIRGSFVWQL